jgi:hypothetical protein
VYRVFPSTYIKIVSALLLQFHKNNTRDSEAVVTPFMQDGTYPSRNFATLGPSELWPPFTGTYFSKKKSFILQHWAGVRFYSSYFYFTKSYVFIKQSLLPLFFYIISFLSRSYKVILPSSFNIINFFVFIFSTKVLVLVLIHLFFLII